MNLLVIQPSQIIGGGKVYKAKKLMFPSLSLPLVASHTPPELQVEIIDEYFEDVPFDDPADLIGISFMTPQAPRAYQIGDEFRKCGKKVVMGGIHASALPEEALEHADAVVVGEAEGIWPQVLEDFNNGKMNGIYDFPNFPIQAGRCCSINREFYPVARLL